MSGLSSVASGIDSAIATLLEGVARQQLSDSQSTLHPFGGHQQVPLRGSATGHRFGEKNPAVLAARDIQHDFGRHRNHSGKSHTPSGSGTGEYTRQASASNSSSAGDAFTSSERLAPNASKPAGSVTSVAEPTPGYKQFVPREEGAGVPKPASLSAGAMHALRSLLTQPGLDQSSAVNNEIINAVLALSHRTASADASHGRQMP